jgi:hypothetical protein
VLGGKLIPVRSVTYVSGRSSCEPDFLDQGAENFAGAAARHEPSADEKRRRRSEFALLLTRLARRRRATPKRRDATCVQFRIGYGATFLLHALGAKR